MSEKGTPKLDVMALFKECCSFLDNNTSPVTVYKVFRSPATAEYCFEVGAHIGRFKVCQGRGCVFAEYNVDGVFFKDEQWRDVEKFKTVLSTFLSKIQN
jgi:hypothetical protein